MQTIDSYLDRADAVVDWLLDGCAAQIERRGWDNALAYLYVAGSLLSQQNRRLTCKRLEEELQRISSALFSATLASPRPKPSVRPACLHVLNVAQLAGGPTAMAIRWMQSDRNDRVHSIALVSQTQTVPSDLSHAVEQSGGTVYLANPKTSFSARAVWLRELALAQADFVILHTGAFDVVAAAAFGLCGGPPVLLVNHTAHTYWTGASVVDLVLNCRGSQQEQRWTQEHRGAARMATLPIPMIENDNDKDKVDAASAPEISLAPWREAWLKVASDDIVLVTTGARFKYLPHDDMDFLAACEEILLTVPNSVLVVIGFHGDARWQKASIRLGGRIRTLGTVSRRAVAHVLEAADIYLEGFPFGTTTALLEAGLKGIPVVLAPNECPPPYGTDGVSVDQVLSRPSTVADYKRMVVALCASQERRQKLGTRLQRAIRHHHVGAGWRLHLEQALRQLPSNHQTSRPTLAPCTAGSAYLYWSRFVDRWGQGLHSPLQRSLLQALDLGLKPTLSKAARAKLQASQPRDPASRLAVLACALLCNGVVGHVPKRLAIGVVRGLSFLCGDKRLSRLLSGLTRAVSANPGVRQWYAEYGAPSPPLIRQTAPATRWAAATRALPGDIAASKRGHPHQHEQHS